MIRFINKLVAKGYEEMTFPEVRPDWIIDSSNKAFDGSKSIMICCPTYVARGCREVITEMIVHLQAQIDQILERVTNVSLFLTIAIQWNDGEKHEADARIEQFKSTCKNVNFCSFTLNGSGKVRSLNAAINYAVNQNMSGILLLDDDVRFDDYALAFLIEEFLVRGSKGVVGGRKIGIPKNIRPARLLANIKSYIKAPVSYPHACCMLVELEQIKDGIPLRYISDDGYIAFKFINPESTNPLENLVIVENAVCRFMVGGPTGETLRRIHRVLLSHVILLADFPVKTSRYFWRNIMFFGFWPLGKFSTGHGLRYGLLRWGIQLLYFVWVISITLELVFRGLIMRPLRGVNWSAYTEYEAPAGYKKTA